MTKEEIENGIKEILQNDIRVDEDSIVMNAKIDDDLGLDSLDVVEFSMAIERKFDITVKDSDVDSWSGKRLSEVVDFVYLKLCPPATA